MKVALRKLLFAARARLALALLRAAMWIGDRDHKPENVPVVTPPPDPITPEARELLVEDRPLFAADPPGGPVLRRVVRSPKG